MIPGLHKRVLNFHDVMLYVALAGKHFRLMVLLVCMCLLAGLAAYVYSRPVYYSRSLIRVDEPPLPVDSETIFHDSSWSALIAGMKSPGMMERIARTLGFNGDFREIDRKYIRQLKITASPEGNGLEVEVYSYDPTWAARWPEAMVDEYMKWREESHQSWRAYISKSWGDVMVDAEQKIDTNLENTYNFQNQNNIVNMTIDLNSLSNLPLRLVQLKQRIDALDGVFKKLDDPGLGTEAKLSLIDSVSEPAALSIGQVITQTGTAAAKAAEEALPGVIPVQGAPPQETIVVPGETSQPEWHGLDSEQHRLEAEITDASRVYLPGNRKMIALTAQLEAVRKKLEIAYQNDRNRLNLERQSLVDQQQYLQQKLPEYEKVNHQYAKLQQDGRLQGAGQMAWQNIYTGIEKYINELDYTADKERVNLQFMGMLYLRPDPVAPNKMNMIIFSLMFGGVLAFAVPFLIEYLDFTLSNLEEVEATFQMRGLGIVPQLTSSAGAPMLLGVGDDNGDRNLLENFRVVRTNLLAMGTLSKAPHVTMITSAMPKEGKTVIASNLAMSFGQTSSRTLLIDTDLRRGRLHRLFGLRKSPGLSDYLLDKVPLSEAIRSSGKENLSILSAGQHVESGTELIGSAKFSDLMIRLRSEYDRIIVDTPPVLGLSETSVLQNHVDGVLFVIWSGRTPIRNMKTAIDILAGNGANFYGFILNRLDLSTTANYYQYYYYSSDYYHSYHALENA